MKCFPTTVVLYSFYPLLSSPLLSSSGLFLSYFLSSHSSPLLSSLLFLSSLSFPLYSSALQLDPISPSSSLPHTTLSHSLPYLHSYNSPPTISLSLPLILISCSLLMRILVLGVDLILLILTVSLAATAVQTSGSQWLNHDLMMHQYSSKVVYRNLK